MLFEHAKFQIHIFQNGRVTGGWAESALPVCVLSKRPHVE